MTPLLIFCIKGVHQKLEDINYGWTLEGIDQ